MAKFGMELPATVTFDYPTVSALAGYVASKAVTATSLTAKIADSQLPGTLHLGSTSGSNMTEVVGISSLVAASGSEDRGKAIETVPHGLHTCGILTTGVLAISPATDRIRTINHIVGCSSALIPLFPMSNP